MTDGDFSRAVLALERIANALEARQNGPQQPQTQEPAPTPTAQAFAAQAPVQANPTQVCPVHNVELRTTRKDGTLYRRAFCAQKNDDGTYCDVKGAWLG